MSDLKPDIKPDFVKLNTLDKVISDSKNDLNNLEQDKIKKRGRPKKDDVTLNQLKPIIKQDPKVYQASLKSLFLFSGVFLATGFKFKGFEISEAEAEQLAIAGSEVAVEFAPQLDSKWTKIGAFMICACSVYGIRVYSYTEYQKALALSENKPDTQNNEVSTN